jgi:hypothetical protein
LAARPRPGFGSGLIGVGWPLLLAGLNLLDLLLTFLALAAGATELNSFARRAFEAGWWAAALYKLVPMFAGVGLWLLSGRSERASRWLRILTFVYLLVVVYQVVNLCWWSLGP